MSPANSDPSHSASLESNALSESSGNRSDSSAHKSDSSNKSPMAEPLPWNLVADGYAQDTMPFFRSYAEDALRLSGMIPGARVLDVAAGPGTLTLLAATTALHVTAVDFSPAMIERLRAEAHDAGLTNIHCEVGDGQALNLPDASFDVAFSLFGVIFFPDRALGLRELRRVVRPGGSVTVSSWVPLRENPLLCTLMSSIAAELPNFPLRTEMAPLGTLEEFEREMVEAGLDYVTVQRVSHTPPIADVETWLTSMERSAAPLAALRHRLGDAYPEFASRYKARLQSELKPELLSAPWPALIGSGRVPAR